MRTIKKINNMEDYEKKYKEALERAKKYKEYDFRLMNAALDDIFPELKESEEKLKEFNVDEYHKNPERKIVTRDGREVEILKIDTKTKTNVPVIAMMDGNDIRFFTTNGRLSLERETCSDLFFADDNCDTCTNDKGCVACKNGELYEGEPNDYTKSNEERVVKLQGDFADINNERGCVKGICHSYDDDLLKTNQEKAKYIANGSKFQSNHFHDQISVEYGAFQMAEWKDRQFKQDLDNAFKSADHVQYTNGYNDAVEKACEWLKDNGRNYHSAYATEDRLIADFKKYMEE